VAEESGRRGVPTFRGCCIARGETDHHSHTRLTRLSSALGGGLGNRQVRPTKVTRSYSTHSGSIDSSPTQAALFPGYATCHLNLYGILTEKIERNAAKCCTRNATHSPFDLNHFRRTCCSPYRPARCRRAQDHGDCVLSEVSNRSFFAELAHRLTPLALDTEEDPDPPSQHFETLHEENTSLQVVEVIQMRTKLEAPCTPQKSVHPYRSIVEFFGVKPAMAS
jgi:hypothetical protein